MTASKSRWVLSSKVIRTPPSRFAMSSTPRPNSSIPSKPSASASMSRRRWIATPCWERCASIASKSIACRVFPVQDAILARAMTWPASRTRRASPREASASMALACMVMPAPRARSSGARSKTRTAKPACRRACAAVNPPIPAPTIAISFMFSPARVSYRLARNYWRVQAINILAFRQGMSMVHHDDTLPRKEPVQERSRALVEALIEATARVLAAEGAEAITTNRVAEVAGTSVGSLYQYFPNKESLVAALIERELQHDIALVRGLVAANADLPLAKLVRLLLQEAVDKTLRRRALHQKILPLVDELHRSALLQTEREAISELFLALFMERWHELASRLTEADDAAEAIRCAAFIALKSMELSFNAVKVEAPEMLDREELPELLSRIFDALMLQE